MKKLLAVFALALFLGGISAPVFASSQNSMTQIVLNEEEPKKTEKKAEKKDDKAAKAEGCESSTKAEKKDCSKTCGGDKS